MKDLILQALNDTVKELDKIAPTTKKLFKSKDIIGVSPLEIVKFMKDNNIPDDAYFNGVGNGYDDWSVGEITLAWDIVVPTTNADKSNFKKKQFNNKAFKNVYDLLTINGYKRGGFSTTLLKEFKYTTVYNMFLDKDYDKLVKYYSLYFTKNLSK